MKIAVAGTGYVGLVLGVVLANVGHEVICVDTNEKKINMMKSGKSPIYEDGLEELMAKGKANLTYTSDYSMAYKESDVIFICVGTPEKADGSANLDYVFNVAEQIAENMKSGTTVVLRSTVPVGTNDSVEGYIKSIVGIEKEFNVVSNPEFLAQGTAVRDTMYGSRLVIGVENEKAKEIMQKVYEPLTKEPYNQPILFMNRRSSEMVKYASNDFLALKISYINEIANFCEELGANIEDVTRGMSYDKRIGSSFLNAGIGYGGSCFPKDTKALHWLSKIKDVEIKTIKACIEVNKMQKTRQFEKYKKITDGNIAGKDIAVLGLTFKPNTDDLREAPSIDNVQLLLDYGANVTVYDPVGMENFKNIFGEKVSYANTIDEAITKKDAAFIMTEWKDIKQYNVENYKDLMNTPIVLDGRNCYELSKMKDAGIDYLSIGR